MCHFHALAIIVLSVSGQALAETPGFFVGLGAGSSHIVEDETFSVFFVPGQNLDERVDFQSFYSGYKFTEKFALEVGYSKLGSAHKIYELRTDILPALPPLQIEDLELDQFSVGAALTSTYWGNWAALGMVGYTLFKVNRTFSIPGRPHFKDNSTENAIYFGVGLAYRINEKLKARIQWTTSDAADFRIQKSQLSLEHSF